MKKQIIFIIVLLLCSILSWADTRIIVSHAITLRGAPKYPEGFTHFDYVNPDAPKGGTLTLNSIGTYDSFHCYAHRGVWAAGSDLHYDTLLVASDDEVAVYYGLIAKKEDSS